MGKKAYIGEMEESVAERIARLKKDGAKHIHEKTKVRVGEYDVFAGGSAFIKQGDLEDVDITIPIDCAPLPMLFGNKYHILCGYWDWDDELEKKWPEFIEKVLAELKAGKKIFAYCFAGHGRVGTLLASLVAILERDIPDPIYAIRERYCPRAVESSLQARMIFALRGEEPPERYKERGSLIRPDDRFEKEE